MSTGAGIPDYRGPNGIYQSRPEVTLQECEADRQVRVDYWRRKAEDWTHWQNVDVPPGHTALADLQRLGKLRAVITQNIDGLHRRAGIEEERMVELHGCNDAVVCLACGFRQSAHAWYPRDLGNDVPACPECGKHLKPAVIQFGENLSEDNLVRAQVAIQEADLVLAIGSTLMVQPAASFPLLAARSGVPYGIINQGTTAHDGMPLVSLRIDGDVDEVLPDVVADVAAMYG